MGIIIESEFFQQRISYYFKRTMMVPTDGEPSNPSCPAITYSHLFSLHDHRYFAFSAIEFKHLLEFTALHLHVYILSILSVSRPGFFRKGSTRLTINNNLFCHNQILLTLVFSSIKQSEECSFISQSVYKSISLGM